jgi:hypothetical protein
MQNPGSDAGVFVLRPSFVIPGRREASSPESITTIARADSGARAKGRALE